MDGLILVWHCYSIRQISHHLYTKHGNMLRKYEYPYLWGGLTATSVASPSHTNLRETLVWIFTRVGMTSYFL
jgi:hypothetical protein